MIYCRQTREEILGIYWEFKETQFMVLLGVHGNQIDEWMAGYAMTSQALQRHPHFCDSLTVGRNFPKDTEITAISWQSFQNHIL